MPKALNKVIFGEYQIDLTGDTVTAADVKKGQTFHDKSGNKLTGLSTLDSDTSDATAAVAEILQGQTAYARGARIEGTMPNRGAVALELQSKATPVKIPQGYHDGSGTVGLNASDAAKLIPGNIRQGVEILDVVGDMTGNEGVKAQAKTAVPKTSKQVITPDSGYTHLTQVTVEAIPYTLTENAAGGQTLTIG